MTVPEELRKATIAQAQGAMALQLAFIGVANGLLETLVDQPASPPELAERRRLDPGYVLRWCEAAYAFGYLDVRDGRFSLTDLGRAFQGNHFLRPAEIEAAFAEVGMPAETFLFGGGLEAVVVGKRVA